MVLILCTYYLCRPSAVVPEKIPSLVSFPVTHNILINFSKICIFFIKIKNSNIHSNCGTRKVQLFTSERLRSDK